jgi:hypothetical protein
MAAIQQRRLLRFGPGIPCSVLSQLSLPQPNKATLLTTSQRIDDFVEFQNTFLRMNEARQMITENELKVG